MDHIYVKLGTIDDVYDLAMQAYKEGYKAGKDNGKRRMLKLNETNPSL